MSLKCSVLKGGFCELTQGFINGHRGLDLVGKNYTIDDIISYDSGQVLMAVTGYGNGAGEGVNWRYGNFVKVLHDNGTVCLYAHMEYVSVKVGQRVSKGQILGRMGNSGNSFGGHLHWEYWTKNDYNSNIDPSPYLEPKEPVVLPKAVSRDKNKRQFQIDYNDNLRIRKEPNLAGEIVGILNAGIYEFTEEKYSDGFNWVKVKDNMWCACTDMSRILEIEKEEVKEEIVVEEEKEIETEVKEETIKEETAVEYEKESVLIWILESLINLIKSVLKKIKK